MNVKLGQAERLVPLEAEMKVMSWQIVVTGKDGKQYKQVNVTVDAVMQMTADGSLEAFEDMLGKVAGTIGNGDGFAGLEAITGTSKK